MLTLLSWVMPLMVISTSLFDILLMLLYQNWLHPWRRILAKVFFSFYRWEAYRERGEPNSKLLGVIVLISLHLFLEKNSTKVQMVRIKVYYQL